MIAKCFDNGGIGDCPMRKFCLARINDPTISGCSMPFVWAGVMDISDAVVEHAVLKEHAEHKPSEESTVSPRRRKRKKKEIK